MDGKDLKSHANQPRPSYLNTSGDFKTCHDELVISLSNIPKVVDHPKTGKPKAVASSQNSQNDEAHVKDHQPHNSGSHPWELSHRTT